MRFLLISVFALPGCISHLGNEYYQKANGEIVSCYPDSDYEFDRGLLGTIVDVDGLTSGDREKRERTIQEMDEREKENRDYYQCRDNAKLNGWRLMSSTEIEERRKKVASAEVSNSK